MIWADLRNVTYMFRQRVNPAEQVRGRKSEISNREHNLRVIVTDYEGKPAAQRDRIEFLKLVQYHLSPKAFERMLELEQLELEGDYESGSEGEDEDAENCGGISPPDASQAESLDDDFL